MFQLGADGLFTLPLHAGIRDSVLAWIPPGTFWMGSESTDAPNEDGPPFRCTITHGYWLAHYPVTQAHWTAIMGTNPSAFDVAGTHPVEQVTWYDALDFCAMLNDLYRSSLPPGYHVTLPTEAEWEYACQLPGLSPLSDSERDPTNPVLLQDLDRIAWYKANSQERTHPVGLKAPNQYGLGDMLGNVYEWNYDSLGQYPHEPVCDWVGHEDESIRSIRGGCWGSSMLGPQVRGWVKPNTKQNWLGFRLCLRYR